MFYQPLERLGKVENPTLKGRRMLYECYAALYNILWLSIKKYEKMYHTLECKNVPNKSYWHLKFWFWLIHFRPDGTNVMRNILLYTEHVSIYRSLFLVDFIFHNSLLSHNILSLTTYQKLVFYAGIPLNMSAWLGVRVSCFEG